MNENSAEHPSWDEMWAYVSNARGPERARALTHLAMHLYERDDNEEAIALLNEALEVLEAAGLYRERASCAHNAGVASAELRRMDDAVTYHLTAAGSYHDALREADAARCLVHAAALEMQRRNPTSASKLYAQAAQTFDLVDTSMEAARAWAAAAEAYRAGGRARRARKCFRLAETRFKQLHQAVEATRCMVAVAWLAVEDGETEASEVAFRRAQSVFAAAGNDEATDDARMGEAVALLDRDPAEASRILSEVLRATRQRGDIAEIGTCERWLARAEAMSGDVDSAIKRLEQAEWLLDAAGEAEAAAETLAERAQFLTTLGQHCEALASVQSALCRLPRGARAAARAFCTLSAVAPLRALGRHAEAERAARKAASLYRRGGLRKRQTIAERLASEVRSGAVDGPLFAVPA